MARVLRNDLVRLFDACHQDLLAISTAFSGSRSAEGLQAALSSISHRHAADLAVFLRRSVARAQSRSDMLRWLHSHPWHTEFLLKSSFIHHALRKPRGYAGDADLMDMICSNDDRGESPFAIAKNRVYLDLPAAAAVRERAQALTELLVSLPPGARVLNMACGPALEVRTFLASNANRSVNFLLLDHDVKTIEHMALHARDARCAGGVANAFNLLKGETTISMAKLIEHHQRDGVQGIDGAPLLRYEPIDLKTLPAFDLVYSSGLFDYIKTTPLNPSRGTSGLTRALFSLVKPGGTLLIGNFRTPGLSDNPHAHHHMTMMDMYSDWRLLYRNDDEIAAFAAGLPKDSIHVALLNETLQPIAEGGVITFLQVKRLH